MKKNKYQMTMKSKFIGQTKIATLESQVYWNAYLNDISIDF